MRRIALPLTLATWEKVDGAAERTQSLLGPMGITREGQSGNPHLDADGGHLWFDDEADAKAIFVTALDDTLQATGPILQLPTAVFEGDESQPFFTGERLYFRQGVTLMAADFRGGALDEAGSWAAPEVQLAVEDRGAPGSLAGAGEPTIATIDGRELLSFVYVVRRADGTLDLNLGQAWAR